MVTFFMPTGATAEKTFIDLERGRIGPSASAFTDVTLGEARALPLSPCPPCIHNFLQLQ